MPGSSSLRPQMQQSRHSRLSSPYPLPARNDTGNSHSPVPIPSRTLYPRRSHKLYVPGKDVSAVTAGASRPSAAGNSMDRQNFTGHILVNAATDDFSGQPSGVSPSVSPMGIVDHKSAPIFSPESSVAKPPVHPDSGVSTQPPQSLPLEHSSNSQQNQGMFHQSHNFSVTGNFIDGNVGSVVYTATLSNRFMKDLLKETIPGAASDSSARYPPPRCHPGTRLAVLERCLHFITHCKGVKKMRWVFGTAGVGKSAVMQNVAESPGLPVNSKVSVFFSINGRDDGTKAIMTLSYQFAAKSEAYRRIIEDEITRDPSLLQSSMPVQFEKFIVRPFIHSSDLTSAGRALIIIDGLDECNNPRTQIELKLTLIFLPSLDDIFCVLPSSISGASAESNLGNCLPLVALLAKILLAFRPLVLHMYWSRT